ncbi:MAG: NUDIX domain-containing protein [Cognatishimia sp.]
MNDLPSIAFERGDHIRFRGAKLTVFVGSQIVTLLRDDITTIPMPNHWDLPGGGREGGESPWECAARETLEEVNLTVLAQDLIWARAYPDKDTVNWFFVAQIPEHRAIDLALGDEGQALRLMAVDDYLTHSKAIPSFQKRMADWIAGS